MMVAAALILVAFVQEPPREEKKLVIRTKDVSPDALLQYVCRECGWTLIYSEKARPEGTITLSNDGPVAEGKIVDFLNTALVKSKVQVILVDRVLKVVTEDEAKKSGPSIFVGSDPLEIPPDDTIRTQVIPLKHVNVVDLAKELKVILDDAAPKWAINTYSNSIIVTEKGVVIYRLVRILRVLDVEAPDRLKVMVVALKNADATETAKMLNDLFKREQQADPAAQNPMWRALRGAMGGGEAPAKPVAAEIVRIVADVRTNSIVVSATDGNLKVIRATIDGLDTSSGEAIRMKLYPLRYADAAETAAFIAKIFEQEQKTSSRGRSPFSFQPSAEPEATSRFREVKAVADVRSNSVVVAASGLNLGIVDQLVERLDRQTEDVLQVKVYKLKNGQAPEMAALLQSMFRPQTRSTVPNGTALAPAQEVQITADARTNSIVIKASEANLLVAEEILATLEDDPTEPTETWVMELQYAKAEDVAKLLRDLFGQGTNVQALPGTQTIVGRTPASQTEAVRRVVTGGGEK